MAILMMAMTIFISIKGIIWPAIMFNIIGFLNAKAYEDTSLLESEMYSEIMLEVVLDKIIKAKEAGKEVFKTNKAIDEFIATFKPGDFEKLINSYINRK